MKTIEIGLPEIDEVEFRLECSPEDTSPEGNASAIDKETDKEILDWIYSELNAGNEWAWCQVKVSARWKGLEGVDYLGCCSYKSESDFREPGGYYDDMKNEAFADLIRQIESRATA